MPAPSADTSADRHRVRAIALWLAFTALLVTGVFLYFRFGDRILPLLDAMADR
jgi:hypothetical protein